MRKFHIKSLTLGLGLGMIITSIISMVYLAGMDPSGMLSEEEIVNLANQYGMVPSTSILVESESKSQKKSKYNEVEKEKPNVEIETFRAEAGKHKVETEKPKEELGKPEDAEISIVPGDTSETVADKLFKAGLIESKDAFVEILDDLGRSSRIQIGEYSIRKGMAVTDIIDVIT
jgi:hypothetical protein